MSSPTKLGEYLASGLHVVGLSGIHAVDRLAISHPSCVTTYSFEEIRLGITRRAALNLAAKVHNPSLISDARNLASHNFNVHHAVNKYDQLYKSALY